MRPIQQVTYIYALVDPRTDECRYVGKTTDLRKRMCSHLTGKHNTYKSKWINYIKPLQPVLLVLEETTGDWVESEQFWIAYMKALGANLTNLSPGGEGTTGYKASAETRQRLRESHLGFRPTEETRRKLSAARTGAKNPFYGKKHSTETCLKICANLQSGAKHGWYLSPKAREARSIRMAGEGNPFYGRHHTEQTKSIIREKVSGEKSVWFGKKHSPETIAKLCAAQKGRTVSEECRAKLRAANLGKKASPETRALLIAQRTGRPCSEATREKIRAKNKAYWESKSPEQQVAEVAERWVARKNKKGGLSC